LTLVSAFGTDVTKAGSERPESVDMRLLSEKIEEPLPLVYEVDVPLEIVRSDTVDSRSGKN